MKFEGGGGCMMLNMMFKKSDLAVNLRKYKKK